MSQPPKSDKRIVSKTAYVALRSKQKALSFSGALFLCASYLGILCGLALGLVLSIIGILIMSSSPLAGVLRIGSGLGLGYLIFRCSEVLLVRGMNIMDKAMEMDIGVPLTRANVVNIPASNSLVRASSEPVQDQESVLLRASLHSQQTPTEQLLRSIEERET